MSQQRKTFTAVIRTKDSAKTIRMCLKALLEQENPPSSIVIVDSGSTDSTLQIVSEFEMCRVVHYPNEPFSYSKSLNLGIGEAPDANVLILSSHCIFVDPQSTRLLLDFLESNETAIAVTLVVSRIRERVRPCAEDEISYRIINRKNFRGHAMDNPCAMIRKRDWKKRPFSEKMKRCEDQEWAYYWIKKSNYFTIMIDQPRIFYDKEFDPRKIAKDFITISRHLHWYHGSIFHIVILVASSALHPSRVFKYSKLIFFLAYYRIFDRKL